MAKRGHISWKTKYAAALLELGDVPYEDAKLMHEDQIISLYHVDHGELHNFTQNDVFWNLTPRLIAPHREKSKIDTKIAAKAKRIDIKYPEWLKFDAPQPKPVKRKTKYRWASRPFQKKNKPRR